MKPLFMEEAMGSRTPFNPVRLRAWRCTSLLVLMWMSGHAHAQWEVTDQRTQQGIETLHEDLEGRIKPVLESMRDQQKIGEAEASTDQDPDDVAEDMKPQRDRLTSVDVAEDRVIRLRCGSEPEVDKKLLRDRWTICTEIVKTEVTQYNYALAMRDVAIKRQERLRAIEDARAELGSGHDKAGELQNNSNQLLALLARMETDRQQYRTYMDAFAERIRYLAALRDSLANASVNGDRSLLGDAVSGLAALGTLKIALDAQKVPKRGSGQFHE